MQKQYGERLVVVGVTQADVEATGKFARDLRTNYPLLANGDANFAAFGVSVIPQVYLIDPGGEIVAEDLDDAKALLATKLGK